LTTTHLTLYTRGWEGQQGRTSGLARLVPDRSPGSGLLAANRRAARARQESPEIGWTHDRQRLRSACSRK